MMLAGQRIQSGRYTVVPRTLSFLLCDDQVLLVRLSSTRGAWAGLFNGIGGHIEQGEDPLTSARREILEETGLHPIDLRLCGVMVVDVGSSPGIALYVLVGLAGPGTTTATPEGEPSWEALDSLATLPLVGDIRMVLPRALEAYRTGVPFSAITTFDPAGEMHLHFAH